MFNIVTNKYEVADAVLIRAIEPYEGIQIMNARRNYPPSPYALTSGPGKLCKALNIQREQHNGIDLQGQSIWLEDMGTQLLPQEIIASPRINVAYAEEDALRPWRFRLKNNAWTSPQK